ncbi:MAG: hypothetical protein ACYCSS_04985 [Sulfuriferula sp.]
MKPVFGDEESLHDTVMPRKPGINPCNRAQLKDIQPLPAPNRHLKNIIMSYAEILIRAYEYGLYQELQR